MSGYVFCILFVLLLLPLLWLWGETSARASRRTSVSRPPVAPDVRRAAPPVQAAPRRSAIVNPTHESRAERPNV